MPKVAGVFSAEPMGVWGLMPPRMRAKWSFPAPLSHKVVGRVELVIGRLGTGKTTWSALRARHLSQVCGIGADGSQRTQPRQLATTGIGWPRPWLSVGSFEELFSLRNAVLVIDEVHLILPSTRGMLEKDDEKKLLKFLSMARKANVDVIGTTQALTRVATHYRQLVTTVWVCGVHKRGVLHVATGFDPVEDGGAQCQPRQYYRPSVAGIPTTATVWTPGFDGSEFDDLAGPERPAPSDEVAGPALRLVSKTRGGGRRSKPAPADPPLSRSVDDADVSGL